VRDVHPLYADGPLKGGDHKVAAALLGPGLVFADLPGGTQVRYQFHRFMLLGRIIWVGAVGPYETIAEADLFDMLVSDRAKQASERIAEQWTT
jgi:hypothetical protein